MSERDSGGISTIDPAYTHPSSSSRSSSTLYPNAASTKRLGTTLGVETSHFRILRNLVISLFDMGGQQAYIDGYLDDRKSQVFKDVGAFVYVFDMGNSEQGDDDDGWEADFRYWR